MASLSKWNPFRFSRNRRGSDASGGEPSRQGAPQSRQAQQQQGEARSSGGQQMGSGGSGVPQAWLDRSGLPDPFRMISSMMMGDPFGAVRRLDSWFGDFSPAAFEPRIDVADRGDAIEITAELAGVDPKDVECTVEDDYVLIEGEKRLEREKQDQEKGVYRVERAFGSFQRVIPLPDGVDAKRAEAKFDNGTLTIRVPKAAETPGRARRLEINTGGSASASGSNPASSTSSSRGGSSSQQG